MTLSAYSDTGFIDAAKIAAVMIQPGNTTDKRVLMFGGLEQRVPKDVAEKFIDLAGKSLVEVEPFSAFINMDSVIFAHTYFDNSVGLFKVTARLSAGVSFTAHFKEHEDSQDLLHLLGVEGGDAAPELPYSDPEPELELEPDEEE